MKKSDIQKVLAILPARDRTIGQVRGSTITLIVSDPNDANIGYDVSLSGGQLKVIRFRAEPYYTTELMTGYELISAKSQDMIRQHLISTYFPELSYLLN
jgi:hypothetical protein